MPTRIARAARLPALVALALPALVSCHNGYDNDCCVSYTPTEGSYGVVAGDFNGDAFTDVLALSTLYPITAAGQSNVKAYLSTGPDAFAAPVLYGAGTDPLWIAAADLNNDGATDVVTASYDDGALAVLFANKAVPGTFNPAVMLSSPGASQVAVLDMNGDGLPDLVSADFGVSLFMQTSAGTFASPVSLYSGGANFVALGDLNNDGVPDVALTDSTGVKVLLRTGGLAATTFAAPATVFTQTVNANLVGANLIAIGDIDGDGLNDLVITDPGPTGGATPTINILLQDPSNLGSFLPPVSYPGTTDDVPVSIVLKDLTGAGNGVLDIVVGNQQSVTVLLHDPQNRGKFLAATTYPAPGANEIAIADVDGDGFLDIITSNGATQPTVNGTVTTEPGVLLQSATTPGTFAALKNLP